MALRPAREKKQRSEEGHGGDEVSGVRRLDARRLHDEPNEAGVERKECVVRLLSDLVRRLPVAGLGEIHVPAGVPAGERRDPSRDVVAPGLSGRNSGQDRARDPRDEEDAHQPGEAQPEYPLACRHDSGDYRDRPHEPARIRNHVRPRRRLLVVSRNAMRDPGVRAGPLRGACRVPVARRGLRHGPQPSGARGRGRACGGRRCFSARARPRAAERPDPSRVRLDRGSAVSRRRVPRRALARRPLHGAPRGGRPAGDRPGPRGPWTPRAVIARVRSPRGRARHRGRRP